MRHQDFDVQDLADSLNGTARSLQGTLDIYFPGMQEDDLTEDELSELDDITTECNTCGWWVDSYSIDEMCNCEECAE